MSSSLSGLNCGWDAQVCGREEGDAALEAIKQKLMDRGVAEDVAEQQLSTEVQLWSCLAAPVRHVI